MICHLIQTTLKRPHRPFPGFAALLVLAALLSGLLVPGLGRAQAVGPAEVCEWAALQAARETGVPADILMALTLTETGRRLDGQLRPWAWSVNAGGQGHWFDDPQSAIRFVEDRVAQGQSNLDLGCFQLNWRWHGENFGSASQMFDPLENARYAARFVGELYLESGDWRTAAGRFHSRTQVYAERYLTRFDSLRLMVQKGSYEGLSPLAASYSYAMLGSGGRGNGRGRGTRRGSGGQGAQDAGWSGQMPRERVMLLGGPLGSEGTNQPASLAVIAHRLDRPFSGAGRPLIETRGRGALIGARAQPPPLDGGDPSYLAEP